MLHGPNKLLYTIWVFDSASLGHLQVRGVLLVAEVLQRPLQRRQILTGHLQAASVVLVLHLPQPLLLLPLLLPPLGPPVLEPHLEEGDEGKERMSFTDSEPKIKLSSVH